MNWWAVAALPAILALGWAYWRLTESAPAGLFTDEERHRIRKRLGRSDRP